MSTTKLQEAQNQAKLNAGIYRFVVAHPDFFECQANLAMLSSEIQLKNLPLEDLKSWEQAFETLKSSLATRPAQAPAAVEEETWPYDFPEIHTVRDLKTMDPGLYKSLWNETIGGRKVEAGGKLTERAQQFRAVVEAIICKTNEERKRQ